MPWYLVLVLSLCEALRVASPVFENDEFREQPLWKNFSHYSVFDAGETGGLLRRKPFSYPREKVAGGSLSFSVEGPSRKFLSTYAFGITLHFTSREIHLTNFGVIYNSTLDQKRIREKGERERKRSLRVARDPGIYYSLLRYRPIWAIKLEII